MSNHLRRAEYFVADVDLAAARDLVARYHYAQGGSNTRVYTHGLFHVDEPERCLGVAWWLPPTKVAALSVSPDWRRVLALTRLVVAPDVPTNGASFLLGQSIALIKRAGAWGTLLTYADEGQGHTGAIYRATNWEYVGLRPGSAVWKDGVGRQVSRKSAGNSRTSVEMEALGYVNTGATRKHKFVMRLEPLPAAEQAA